MKQHIIFQKSKERKNSLSERDGVRMLISLLDQSKQRPALFLDYSGESTSLMDAFPDTDCESHRLLPFLMGDFDKLSLYMYPHLWWSMFGGRERTPPHSRIERNDMWWNKSHESHGLKAIIESLNLLLGDFHSAIRSKPIHIANGSDGVSTSGVCDLIATMGKHYFKEGFHNDSIRNIINRMQDWSIFVKRHKSASSHDLIDDGWGNSLWGDKEIGYHVVVADVLGDDLVWGERYALMVSLVNSMIQHGGGTIFINEPSRLVNNITTFDILHWILVHGSHYNIQVVAMDSDPKLVIERTGRWEFLDCSESLFGGDNFLISPQGKIKFVNVVETMNRENNVSNSPTPIYHSTENKVVN